MSGVEHLVGKTQQMTVHCNVITSAGIPIIGKSEIFRCVFGIAHNSSIGICLETDIVDRLSRFLVV